MTRLEALLRSAAADPRAQAWNDLYHEVCHQGECYPSAFFLIPGLTEIAAGFAPADRDNVIIFAGQIAVDLDGGSRVRYAENLTRLRRLADEWLATPTDDQTFVYRLQAILALEGDPIWGKHLDGIIDEEYGIHCPACSTFLFVAIGYRGHFATPDDDVRSPGGERTALLPATPDQLTGLGRRLYTLSRQAGHDSVASALTYVFGRATCPRCGAMFQVGDQIRAF